MFGKKLVSDSLLAAVKDVTSGEQIDSTGNELLVGDGVTVQEGPYAGRTGTISGFQNTGRSEVQLDHGPSVALYNEKLLNEEDADGTRPRVKSGGLKRTPAEEKAAKERAKRWAKPVKLKKGSRLAKGWDPTDEEYDPELDEEEDTVSGFVKRGGKIEKLPPRAARGSAKGKMTLKSKNPKGGGERGRKAEKKMHGEDYDIDEAATAHKVGDTVIATKGPHVGIKHKVIHDHGNGKYNVQPVGLDVKHIKYRLGAATAHGKHLIPHSTNEEVDLKEDAVTSFVKEMRGEGRKAKVYTATGNGGSLKAQFTNKKWEDGVPVTKNLTRGGNKSVKTPRGNFKVIETDTFWYYEINKGWAAVSRQQYNTPPWNQSASTNEETLGEILDNPDAKRRYLEKSKQSLSRTQDDIKYGPTSTQKSQGTAVSDYVKLATRRRNRERGIKRVESNEEYEVDESRLDSHRGDKLAPEYDEAESRRQAEKNRKKWRAGNKRLNKQYDAPGKSKKVDESEMSQAEIIRRRKDQHRERVRGKRKSGKVSDKMYDYELRKSEGKPVNVPKTKNEEWYDESLEEVATNFAKRGSGQTGDAQVYHPAKAQFGRKSKSERLGREKGPSGKTPEKSWSKERGNYDDRGPKQKTHDAGVEAQRGKRAKKWAKISSDQLKRYRGRQHGGGPEGKPAKYSHTVGAAGKRASEGGHLESPKAEKQRRNAHPLRRGVKTKGATSTGKSPAVTAHKAKNRATGHVDATRVGGATRGGQYPSRGTRYEEVEELVLDHLLLDRLLDEAGLDAVDKKSLKKKWKDREDQDIDNDGDEDESDEYLHNRRQTVDKKISKRKGKKKNGNGNGNGEKIEINPDMEEQAHSRNERIIEVIKDALKKNIRIEEGRHGVGSDEATQEYKDATPGQSGEFEDALDYDKYSADNFVVPDAEVDDMLEKGSYFKP